MHIPKDLLKIIMCFKRDMELLERSCTNCFMGQELLPYCGAMERIAHIYDFPFQILYDYIEARGVYRERLAVWGLNEVFAPQIAFPMLL